MTRGADPAKGPAAILGSVPAWCWLMGITACSFTLLAIQSLGFHQPVVFVDELIYSNAAKRLAIGLPPGVDAQGFGYGILYPLLLAPLYRLLPHTTDAYTAIKLVNAAAFSLAAVPVYFIARRVARPGLAVGVALLTVLLPARAYVPLVLTESVAFLVFLVAVLATLRVMEDPTVARQLVMLGILLIAVQARTQNLVLVAAVPLMLLSWITLSGGQRGSARRLASRYWPTWSALTAAVLWACVWPITRGENPSTTLGAYAVLAQSYDVADVFRWTGLHLGAFAFMLAVVPFVALPFGLAACFGKNAPTNHMSVGLSTLVLVPAFVVAVGVFSSSPYGLNRIHERNLFYVAPLVLAVLARWVDASMPRARRAAAFAAVAAISAIPFVLALDRVGINPIDAPVLWMTRSAEIADIEASPLNTFAWIALLVLSTVAALWVFVVRPLYGFALLAVTFALIDIGVDNSIYSASRQRAGILATAGRPGLPKDWVDRTIGGEPPVEMIYVTPSQSCISQLDDSIRAERVAQHVVFFNSGISQILSIGPRPDVGLRRVSVEVTGDGGVLGGGVSVRAPYIVADSRIRLDGVRIAIDPATRLSLWKTDGRVRVLNVSPTHDLGDLVCSVRS